MSSCCPTPDPVKPPPGCCSTETTKKSRPDILLLSTLVLVSFGYFMDLLFAQQLTSFSITVGVLFSAVRGIMDSMWIGLGLGMLFVGLLGRVPREFVTALLGKGDSFVGILRATFAGVLLDLCSHGILLVAMRLYQRGASLGQVMAF